MDTSFTFAIIKPDAVGSGKTGPILAMINEAGFEISAMKMLRIDISQAQAFYEVHKERPFYSSLVEFMSSGPAVVMILKYNDAVNAFRKLIGATDPQKADEGTVRRKFATSVQYNAVHGSDSLENAAREADFFFSGIERF